MCSSLPSLRSSWLGLSFLHQLTQRISQVGTYGEKLGASFLSDYQQCESGNFLPTAGAPSRHECLPCYENSVKFSFLSVTPFDSKDSCICREGDILVEFKEMDENGFIGECKACEEISEEGTDCDQRGVKINNMKVSE